MTIKDTFLDQFREPRGALGRVAGRIMATRSSNVERNRRTIELLGPAPDAQVLEIGYGPGLAVEGLARLVPDGHVTGVDHSATMRRAAARRLRAAGLAERVDLFVGDANALGSMAPGPFDCVLAVNVWMFWSDQIEVLTALRSRLVPGGRLAITYQPRHGGATADDTQRATALLLDQMTAAGFAAPTATSIPVDGVPAVAVLATAPLHAAHGAP